MSADVAIVKCYDYEYADVDKAIRRCIELLPKDTIPRNKKILLKPNLLSSTKGPDKPVNTHPIIVEVIAKILKNDYGCTVFIGDSSGGMSYGQTKRSFEVSGLCDISKRLGVELINFESTGVIELRNENNKIKKEFSVTKFIKEVDYIISLPKLKTHSSVGFTGAIKNMMGVVPGSGKRAMHISALKPYQMSQCIVDLYSLVKPDLSIMDAVIGMEGDGPAVGDPRNIGLILASNDGVALDAVALEVVDYNKKNITYIEDAEKRGLGIGNIEKINILGEQIKNIKIHDFKKPISRMQDYIMSFLPNFILRIGFFGMTSGVPVINQIFCKRCNICYDNCPVKTIEKFPDGRLKIDHSDCIECYCCHELCPHEAISIKLPLSSKIVRKSVSIIGKVLGLLGK